MHKFCASLTVATLILSARSSIVFAHEPPQSSIKLGVDLFDSVSGQPSTKFTVNNGELYTRINPSLPDGTLIFAREVVGDSANWQFNTNNRFTFWFKAPTNAAALKTNGSHNFTFGTNVKRVNNADPSSHTTGGFHAHHELNIPPTGTWTKIVLNMHPDQIENQNVTVDPGNQLHPTGESSYNYFDALTQFYLNAASPSKTPTTYLLDQSKFRTEINAEEDDQIYSIAGTYIPAENRIIMTWNRDKANTKDKHFVKYAFEDIHSIGWDAAFQAPNWRISPNKNKQNNGMVYNNNSLNLAGRDKIFIAIKPQNSDRFTQIEIPLTLDGTPPGNQPPSVYAGPDLTIFQNNAATLNGSVTDDGKPVPPGTLVSTWQKASGQGTVSFANPSQAQTTATFSRTGTYQVRLQGNDGTKKQGGTTVSDTAVITVLSADTKPPNITNIQVASIAQTSAYIAWLTNEDTTAEVEYGLSTAYGETKIANTLQGVNHSITLDTLLPSTQYHFRIRATDTAGNVALSKNQTMTTEALPNTAPTIDSFVPDITDRDDQFSGLQVYAGDTVSVSASASDVDKDTLYWAWYTSVNGEAGVLQSTGVDVITNFVHTFLVEDAESTNTIVLHVTDGKDLVTQSLPVDILEAPLLCTNIRLSNRDKKNQPQTISDVKIRVENAQNKRTLLSTVQSSDATGNIVIRNIDLLSPLIADSTRKYDLYAKPQGYIESKKLNITNLFGENCIPLDNPLIGDFNGDNTIELDELIRAVRYFQGETDELLNKIYLRTIFIEDLMDLVRNYINLQSK